MLSPAASALLAPVAAIDGFRLASLVGPATGMVVSAAVQDPDDPSRPASARAVVLLVVLDRSRADLALARRALYFSDGRVVFAESAGTPGPVIGAQPDGAADPAVSAAWAVPAALAAAEPVDGSTARALAWELRRSVFGMTIDVYRLMVLRLLSAVDYPVVPGMRPLREPPGRGVLPHVIPSRSINSERRCAVSRSADDRVRAELRLIRDNVAGVHGSLVATNDGFLVAHDIPDIEPTAVAALAATTRSLASRTTESTGRGRFREAISRGSHGYLVVYAAGRSTLLAVVGTTDLNIGMLHYQTREIAERIATYATQFGTEPGPAPAVPGGGPGPGGLPARPPAPLPVRRKAAG